MTDDTARRKRPDFGPEMGRNLVYVGRNTTIADVVKHIDEQDAEIAALREAVRLGNKVMLKLKEHGPAIVPHLLDDDENDGERFRQAIRALEQKP